MKIAYKIIVIFSILSLAGCGSIMVISDKEAMAETREVKEQRYESQSTIPGTPVCQECFVVPKSGTNRDLRRGYYFDQEEGKCKAISYSSGTDCIPAPFKTLDECIDCCGGSK